MMILQNSKKKQRLKVKSIDRGWDYSEDKVYYADYKVMDVPVLCRLAIEVPSYGDPRRNRDEPFSSSMSFGAKCVT